MRVFTFTLSIIISLFLFLSCGTESTPTYTLSTSVVGEGTITPSGGTYEEGETVTLTSTPSQHWVFNNWSGDGSGSSSTVTITMDRDKSVVGNFQRRDYPLTITIDGEGTVGERIVSSPKTTDYPYETVVELTPNPSDGWVFYQWNGDLSGIENPQNIEVIEGKEVTSVFKSIDELLTIEIIGEGTIDIQQESFENNPSRRTVTLTPTPSENWNFEEWGGDISSTDEVVTVTLDDEKKVTVKFTTPVFLGENGITIMCPDGNIGDIGVVNGVEYEVVDRQLLLKRYEEGRGNLSRKVCVSLITDMSQLFRGLNFNETINHWDVSNVTNMSWMFYESSFNQPIGEWNVGSVTNMMYMFSKTSFNQSIGKWNVSSVKNMEFMFWVSQFNQPIKNWDVSSVTNMRSMFHYTPFNQPLGNWNVSKVENMWGMFSNSSFNQLIGEWDVSNVTNMRWMFQRSPFNQSIGDWDTENVNNMGSMFSGSQFNQNITGWCVWRIGTEPDGFSNNSPLTHENKPFWGTCPD